MLKFLGFMWNPLSWVMEIAALMAIGLANGGVFFFFFFLFSWPLASYIYFCLLVCALFFVIEIYFFLITAMQGKPPDWQDFIGIVVLLLINSTISFIEENNAGNAAAALMAGLAPKTKVVANFGWLQDPPWFKLVKSEWGCSNMGHEGLVHVYRSHP